MKKVTLIATSIAVILLFIPFVLGMQAQNALEQGVNSATEQYGGYINAELEDFDRGWFSSTGKIRVGFSQEYVTSMPALQASMPDGELIGDLLAKGFAQDIEISHGPFTGDGLGLGRVVSTIDANSHPDLSDFLTKTGNTYLLRSAMTLGFGGAGSVSMDAPAFQISDFSDNLDDMVFAGAAATGSIDFSDLHFQVEGHMNGLSLVSSQGEALVERTTFISNMTYPEHAPYGLGDGAIKVSRVVALSGNQANFDMRQANITFATTQSETADPTQAKVALELSYVVEELIAAGTELKDLEVSFGMEELDSLTLAKLQNLGRHVQANPNDVAEILAQFTDPLYDLLAGGAVVKVDPVRFVYNDQPFNAKVVLRSKPDNLPNRSAFSLENPMLLASLFQVDADISIDQQLATELAIPQLKQQLLAGVPADTEVDDAQLEQMARAQAPMMMGALVGQGMLREDGTNYTVQAQYDNGALLVNGTPIPLGAMLQANKPQ